MSGIKLRIVHELLYETRNTLRARSFRCYIIVGILMCISGYVQGGAFDGAFGLLVGIEHSSLDDISMSKIINWLMPHLMLSVYIGECGERDMRMQRYIMPRYSALRNYWRFQAIKLVIISLMYYAIIVAASSLVSYILGNRLIKVSEMALSHNNLYSGSLPSTWLIMLEILLRAGLTMAMVGLIQLALSWLTGNQRGGVAAFAVLMPVPMFIQNSDVQRLLPCDMSMYIRGSAVGGGLSLIWVCAICIFVMAAVIESICASSRLRTIIVN